MKKNILPKPKKQEARDEPLEFTSTAMCRPGIFKKTIDSFSKNLRGIDFSQSTMYINIDPLPDPLLAKDVIDIAKSYFKTVIANTPSVANFSKAVKWCWMQPKGEFFFHLEDDWVLRQPVNFRDMRHDLRRRKLKKASDKLLSVNLRAYKTVHDTRVRLSPCLIRTAYAQVIAPKIRSDMNPEAQMRANKYYKSIAQGYGSLMFPVTNKSIVPIVDIGIDWLNRQKDFSRPIRGEDQRFITWINSKS